MNLLVQTLTLGVAFTTLWICVVAEEKPSTDELPKFVLADCKKTVARIAKWVLKAFGTCTKEMKANLTEIRAPKDEFEKKLGCVVRCTLFKLELLDEHGKVTPESSQKFLDKYIPQEAHEFTLALTASCSTEYGKKLDMSEEYCESYNNFVRCLQSTVADWAEKSDCHPGQKM